MPWLRALRELDLDHLDRRVRGAVGESGATEAPVFLATAEVAGPDLPDQISAGLEVMRAGRALAGIVIEAAELRAAVERANGCTRERAEAHR